MNSLEMIKKSIFGALIAWSTLGGGAGAAPQKAAALLQRVISPAPYVSHWDGHRISTQAMRQVW